MNEVEANQKMSAKTARWAGRAFQSSSPIVATLKPVNEAVPVVSATPRHAALLGTMDKEPISAPSRVVVVEPDAHTRTHFREILQSTNDFMLTGEFSNATEVLNVVPRLPPDLMLLGVRRRDLIGIKCISLFKRLMAGLRIIMVLGAGDMDLLESGLRSGADDCLVKPINAAQCLVTLVSSARAPIEITPKPGPLELGLFDRANSGRLLSGREQEVMGRLARGRLYKEIAFELQMSEALVRKHAHKIYRKFQVQNRAEAIGVWFNQKWRD